MPLLNHMIWIGLIVRVNRALALLIIHLLKYGPTTDNAIYHYKLSQCIINSAKARLTLTISPIQI
ncbi:hypothetical protein ACN38_g13042, partial [Penicillium nordicum]